MKRGGDGRDSFERGGPAQKTALLPAPGEKTQAASAHDPAGDLLVPAIQIRPFVRHHAGVQGIPAAQGHYRQPLGGPC